MNFDLHSVFTLYSLALAAYAITGRIPLTVSPKSDDLAKTRIAQWLPVLILINKHLGLITRYWRRHCDSCVPPEGTWYTNLVTIVVCTKIFNL